MRTNDENYERAVSIFKSRYGDVDQLVFLHKQTLLKTTPADGFGRYMLLLEARVLVLSFAVSVLFIRIEVYV